MGQFIGGQCSFSGESHYNVKLDLGRKITAETGYDPLPDPCVLVSTSSDHSSERTKGLMRDRGRMDPRTE